MVRERGGTQFLFSSLFGRGGEEMEEFVDGAAVRAMCLVQFESWSLFDSRRWGMVMSVGIVLGWGQRENHCICRICSIIDK